MTSSNDAAGSPEDEVLPAGSSTGEHPPHNASGLMPAQNDAALEEIAPDRVEKTDAFGRTPDER